MPLFCNFLHRNVWVLCTYAIISSTALTLLSPEKKTFFRQKYTKCHLAAMRVPKPDNPVIEDGWYELGPLIIGDEVTAI